MGFNCFSTCGSLIFGVGVGVGVVEAIKKIFLGLRHFVSARFLFPFLSQVYSRDLATLQMRALPTNPSQTKKFMPYFQSLDTLVHRGA